MVDWCKIWCKVGFTPMQWCKDWCKTGFTPQDSGQLDSTVDGREAGGYLVGLGFVVDVHGSRDTSMSHDFLHDLDV